jgi:hypothetical protein
MTGQHLQEGGEGTREKGARKRETGGRVTLKQQMTWPSYVLSKKSCVLTTAASFSHPVLPPLLPISIFHSLFYPLLFHSPSSPSHAPLLFLCHLHSYFTFAIRIASSD